MSFVKINHENIKNQEKLIPKDTNVEKNISLKLYKFAKRLRIIEEKLSQEYHPANQMKCPVHFCIGQESVPAALRLILSKKDYLFCHHRSHGYYLSKKSPLKNLVAELYGKKNGANGGLAGSQDISYENNNFFSGAILAGSIGIATGNAMAQKIEKKGGITVVGFGESACDVGLFWESINYAFLKKLPILFICENNNYSVFSPQKKRQAGREIFEKVKMFGNYSEKIFGNNISSLFKKIDSIAKSIRNNSHPFFLEVVTYRISSHYGPDIDTDIGYRDRKEVAFWKKYCPITMLENKLINRKILTNKKIEIVRKKCIKEIEKAIIFSKKSPLPNKFEINNLHYAKEKDYKSKIVKLSTNLKNSLNSKQKIIGY